MEKNNKLSRIDRAIADNIPDITSSFEENAGIVQDFIVFILHRMQFDLFGFTTFKLSDFTKATGRHRPSLSYIIDRFEKGIEKAPERGGYKFQTVFDYALHEMMRKNLIFEKAYTTLEGNREIKLEAIRIISDLKITYDPQNKKTKIYQVKISDELLNGFVRRYYTLDFSAYKAIGKGRGGDQRKTFMIYIAKLRHILWSKNMLTTTLALDQLVHAAGIKAAEAKHKKQNVKRLLDTVRTKTGFSLKYEFITGNTAYTYFVKLTFPYTPYPLKEEHLFYADLIDSLKLYYLKYNKDTGGFQEWLNDASQAMDAKVYHLKRCFYKRTSKELTDVEAVHLIKFGLDFSGKL